MGHMATNMSITWAPPAATAHSSSNREFQRASEVGRLLADTGHYLDAVWVSPHDQPGSCAPPLNLTRAPKVILN